MQPAGLGHGPSLVDEVPKIICFGVVCCLRTWVSPLLASATSAPLPAVRWFQSLLSEISEKVLLLSLAKPGLKPSLKVTGKHSKQFYWLWRGSQKTVFSVGSFFRWNCGEMHALLKAEIPAGSACKWGTQACRWCVPIPVKQHL